MSAKTSELSVDNNGIGSGLAPEPDPPPLLLGRSAVGAAMNRFPRFIVSGL